MKNLSLIILSLFSFTLFAQESGPNLNDLFATPPSGTYKIPTVMGSSSIISGDVKCNEGPNLLGGLGDIQNFQDIYTQCHQFLGNQSAYCQCVYENSKIFDYDNGDAMLVEKKEQTQKNIYSMLGKVWTNKIYQSLVKSHVQVITMKTLAKRKGIDINVSMEPKKCPIRPASNDPKNPKISQYREMANNVLSSLKCGQGKENDPAFQREIRNRMQLLFGRNTAFGSGFGNYNTFSNNSSEGAKEMMAQFFHEMMEKDYREQVSAGHKSQYKRDGSCKRRSNNSDGTTPYEYQCFGSAAIIGSKGNLRSRDITNLLDAVKIMEERGLNLSQLLNLTSSPKNYLTEEDKKIVNTVKALSFKNPLIFPLLQNPAFSTKLKNTLVSMQSKMNELDLIFNKEDPLTRQDQHKIVDLQNHINDQLVDFIKEQAAADTASSIVEDECFTNDDEDPTNNGYVNDLQNILCTAPEQLKVGNRNTLYNLPEAVGLHEGAFCPIQARDIMENGVLIEEIEAKVPGRTCYAPQLELIYCRDNQSGGSGGVDVDNLMFDYGQFVGNPEAGDELFFGEDELVSYSALHCEAVDKVSIGVCKDIVTAGKCNPQRSGPDFSYEFENCRDKYIFENFDNIRRMALLEGDQEFLNIVKDLYIRNSCKMLNIPCTVITETDYQRDFTPGARPSSGSDYDGGDELDINPNSSTAGANSAGKVVREKVEGIPVSNEKLMSVVKSNANASSDVSTSKGLLGETTTSYDNTPVKTVKTVIQNDIEETEEEIDKVVKKQKKLKKDIAQADDPAQKVKLEKEYEMNQSYLNSQNDILDQLKNMQDQLALIKKENELLREHNKINQEYKQVQNNPAFYNNPNNKIAQNPNFGPTKIIEKIGPNVGENNVLPEENTVVKYRSLAGNLDDEPTVKTSNSGKVTKGSGVELSLSQSDLSQLPQIKFSSEAELQNITPEQMKQLYGNAEQSFYVILEETGEHYILEPTYEGKKIVGYKYTPLKKKVADKKKEEKKRAPASVDKPDSRNFFLKNLIETIHD